MVKVESQRSEGHLCNIIFSQKFTDKRVIFEELRILSN